MDVDYLFHDGPMGEHVFLKTYRPPIFFVMSHRAASILEAGDTIFPVSQLSGRECISFPGSLASSYMDSIPKHALVLRYVVVAGGVAAHGIESSLCSHNITCEGKTKNMHKIVILTTASLLLVGVILIFSPENAVSATTSTMKVAGFQIDPILNGCQDPGIVEWGDFSKGDCFSPHDAFGMIAEYGMNNISIAMAGLGSGVTAHSGSVGTLCMTITEPGEYVLSGHKILCGDTDALELPNPTGCSGKLLLVQDCTGNDTGTGNDTNGDTGNGGGDGVDPINFIWEPLDPITVCAGESFCVNLSIDIPVATELDAVVKCVYTMFSQQYGGWRLQ